ncbi:ketopantoate reductase family protein [Pseudogracilibacillus auburnensis]|uniref:ketopantoate reductase family protein n=1 Tax=Pseudogracilibacillus auburnensis TaxID=1494959 RepID=UPI001A9753E3|nr:2-dehydropantoate 2-reductase [Pseudogracilibacillus auburnensis]MBO1005501.1 2-dehydropantoate 2-reductase [Pseudogracilibacillus auburnensis]
MEIGVIGGGSIGLLLTSYLADKHKITLYVNRKAQQKQIELNAIRLLKGSVKEKTAQVSTRRITELQQKDCIFVCVKQPEIEQVISHFAKINKATPLIFLQNGMGHIKYLEELPNPSYVGVVSHGAHRENDYTVNHLGQGEITLSSVTGDEKQLRYMLNQLNDNHFPFAYANNWNVLLKNKLIINAVINPLTALFDVPNGSIITNNHLHFLAKMICNEAAAVLQLDQKNAWEKVLTTATITRENISSMRADLIHKRPTEIEAISGYILHQTDEELPYTSFAYHAILALEQKKEK